MTQVNPIEFSRISMSGSNAGDNERAGNLIGLDAGVAEIIADAIALALTGVILSTDGEKRFVPNTAAKAEYQLAVLALTSLTALDAATARVFIRVEDSEIRYTVDALNPPIAGVGGVGFGIIVKPTDTLWLNAEEAALIRFISNTGISSYLHVEEYKEPA